MEAITLSKTTVWILGLLIPTLLLIIGTAVGFLLKRFILRLDKREDVVDTQYRNLDAKLDSITKGLIVDGNSITAMETKLDQHDQNFKTVFHKLEEMGTDINSIDTQVAELLGEHKMILARGGH